MLDLIALVISLVAAALATYAAIQTYHLDKASFRVSNYHQFDALLIEIDKQLIEFPQLSAIFDAAPFEGEPLEKRRLEAFVYMHLDLFQMVHSFIEDRTQKGALIINPPTPVRLPAGSGRVAVGGAVVAGVLAEGRRRAPGAAG
ncbi:MAG: hypothetical protein KA142_13700, partial [Chromatiaceae bacterium]|nr:hypothetical protein [Chromatiaceae bacterium]